VLKWLEKGGSATTADLARAELITGDGCRSNSTPRSDARSPRRSSSSVRWSLLAAEAEPTPIQGENPCAFLANALPHLGQVLVLGAGIPLMSLLGARAFGRFHGDF
jgi:hypothetical protein